MTITKSEKMKIFFNGENLFLKTVRNCRMNFWIQIDYFILLKEF